MSSAEDSDLNPRQSSGSHPGANGLMWTVWFTYGAFYFCRTNISAAIPGLKATVADGGFGFTNEECGLFLGAFKIAYAAGQLINGQLSEQLSPRKMLAIGMFGTAALNILFGFAPALYFFIFIWACNGFSQSLGWTPCVRVLANWFPVRRRGRVIGFVGTGYMMSGAATYVVSGFAAESFGWQGAFFIPAAIMFASAFVMLVLLREQPEQLQQDDTSGAATGLLHPTNDARNSALENFLLTITNPRLWLLGLSLGLLNACRYGFLDWGLTHLKEVQETGVGSAAIKIAVLPFGAIAGSYIAGWATDRFFDSRRAPVTCILLVILSLLTLVYHPVANSQSVPATMALLILIGFCIYGPQVLLVGTAPADLARKGTSAAAAGFVNCLGYIGAASGDYFTGRSLDAAKGVATDSTGWEHTIYLWAAWAFAAAVAAGLLWGATAVDHKES